MIRLLAATLLTCCLFTSPGMAGERTVGLITKTNDNPFFVTMKQAARGKADALGLELRTYAGGYDGDSKAQAEAVKSLAAAGAKGILITPSDPAALLDAATKARAAGVLVIALDTPFDPADTVDATFATDNFRAGELIGAWARASMGESARIARIATLDLSEAPVTVNVLRNQGFLKGFGVDIKDPRKMYDEDDAGIAGSGASLGTETAGHMAMEALMRNEPGIDFVYAINEPAAGAHPALRVLGVEKDVLVVSVYGGCAGVRNVAPGAIGATAMQYPLRMASLGLEAMLSSTGRAGGRRGCPARTSTTRA